MLSKIMDSFRGHHAARGGRFVGRSFAADDFFSFDSVSRVMDSGAAAMFGEQPIHPGVKLPFKVTAANGKVCDSSGAFLVGELERLDPKMNDPLVAVSWPRDIDLREDATIADEVTSFTISQFASAGSLGAGNSIGNGKAWIGKNTNEVAGVGVDIAKYVQPLRLWGLELKYTIPEIESAARLGRPIDQQKFANMQLKHDMDIDEQVYIGDTSTGDTGLVNMTSRTGSSNPVATNAVAGASGSTLWANKSPDEILADINYAITTTWASAGWAVMPDRILIPPAQYGYLATAKVSLAGNVSILKYVLENNLITTTGQGKLEIFPLKWLIGAGAGGTIGTVGNDRMITYSKKMDYVRYPMTLLQRTPIQYDSIFHKVSYFCRLGVVEAPYPETLSYLDQI